MRSKQNYLYTLLFLCLALGMSSCGEDEDFSYRTATVNGEAGPARDYPDPQPVEAVDAFPWLDFDHPVFLTSVPGDEGMLAVAEQEGVIKVFEDKKGSEAVTLLDITDKVKSGGEEGLIGLAFDPRFKENGYFYVDYTTGPPGRTVVSRFEAVSGDGLPQADRASETIILEQPQPYSNHNGGMLAFGSDGYLYIAFGDGGGQGDPDDNAQDLTSILGKILRIDVTSADPYSIPEDNPFTGQADARGEVWAYGFRNPYRFSVDRDTGDIWAGDVGAGSREEVDLVVSGGNYGWPLFEGSEVHSNPDGVAASEFVAPVIDYGRSEGISVIGGYVYRGSRIPGLRGAYIFGDYGSGTVWALVYDGTSEAVVSNTAIAEVPTISSFGEDADGEVYVISLEGGIYRLEDK